jgi:hypothetical protein
MSKELLDTPRGHELLSGCEYEAHSLGSKCLGRGAVAGNAKSFHRSVTNSWAETRSGASSG